jgi:hypothetical protein
MVSVQKLYGLMNAAVEFEEGEGDLSCKRLLREEAEPHSRCARPERLCRPNGVVTNKARISVRSIESCAAWSG